MKSNLPAGWTMVKIGDILSFSGGGTPSKHITKYWNGEILWASVKDVKGKFLTKTQDTITQAGLESSATQLAEPGDILMVTRMAPGRPIITKVQTAINQDLKIVRAKVPISSLFIYYSLLNSKQEFLDIANGTTVQGIRIQDIIKIEIPFPPILEQERIVAKVEATMKKIEASQERLDKLPVLLKKFRRAVLSAAVSGTLTEAWRAERPQGVSATELLDRIRVERRTQWEEKQLAKMTGKQLNLIENWKHKYEEPLLPDTSELPVLPEGWIYVSLDQLTNGARPSSYGVLIPGSDIDGGIPMVRVGDINDGKVSVENLKRIAPHVAEEFKRTRLEGGELLITLVGSIGRTAIVPKELAGANTARAVGVIPLVEAIDKHWIEFYFRNPEKVVEMVTKSHEVARKTLNLDDVRRTAVVIPPLAEQQEIVRQVNHYFTLADQLETRLEQAAEMVEQIPYGLLAKAFSGQLVPQNPDDEPASQFLSNIKLDVENKAKEDAKNGRHELTTKIEPSPKKRTMKAKPAKSFPEFIERLNALGGVASPVQLLSESLLEDDIDTFFELLKEGRDKGTLNVPVGQSGLISLVEHAN